MYKILVVDDDDEVLETIQLILEIGGYEVEPLNNAKLIFDQINSFQPNLIILDVVLGNFDGRVLCQQIKSSAKTQHIPILMMSGLYDLAEVKNMENPPNDFLPKPFKMDVLLDKINKLVDKKHRYNIN